MSTDPQSRSISELTRELTDQTSRLAQKEIELAKAELSAKGRQAEIGLGAFGGAGLVAVLGALVEPGDQGLPVGEVPVDGRARDARRGGDVGEGRARRVLEEAFGGGEDALLAAPRVGAAARLARAVRCLFHRVCGPRFVIVH